MDKKKNYVKRFEETATAAGTANTSFYIDPYFFFTEPNINMTNALLYTDVHGPTTPMLIIIAKFQKPSMHIINTHVGYMAKKKSRKRPIILTRS